MLGKRRNKEGNKDEKEGLGGGIKKGKWGKINFPFPNFFYCQTRKGIRYSFPLFSFLCAKHRLGLNKSIKKRESKWKEQATKEEENN